MNKIIFSKTRMVLTIAILFFPSLGYATQSLEDLVQSEPLPLSKSLRPSLLTRVNANFLEKKPHTYSIKNIFMKRIRDLIILLAIQSSVLPVSASYNFEGTEKLGKDLATYFNAHPWEFAHVASNPDKTHQIENGYILQLHKKKGFYVTLNENLRLYHGDDRLCVYSSYHLFHDIECCETIGECAAASHKKIKFLEPKFDELYSDTLPIMEAQIEFSPFEKSCSLAKRVRFFLTVGKKDNQIQKQGQCRFVDPIEIMLAKSINYYGSTASLFEDRLKEPDLVSFLPIPMSTSYTFEGTGKIGKLLAYYFSTYPHSLDVSGAFPESIKKFENTYTINNTYTFQFDKKKGMYVTLKEDVLLYDEKRYCIYTPETLLHDMECCEIKRCKSAARKHIRFSEPKTNIYSGLTTIDVDIEFTSSNDRENYMCSLAKKVTFFLLLS